MSFINDVFNALFNIDVVGVYNQTSGEQIFTDASVMKASVARSAELFTHPLETSEEVTDHFIINQDEIRLQLIITDAKFPQVYQEITQAFRRGDVIDMKLKVGFFSNLLIQELPHEEDPELLDAIRLELVLKEIQFGAVTVVVLPESQVENKVQSSTIDRGVQNPEEPRQTVFSQIIGAIS